MIDNSAAINRLKKNQKRLKPWLKREGIKAYRLYDADIPEFAAAVDIYDTEQGLYVVVQEYQAGKNIDEQAAEQRFEGLLQAIQQVCGVDNEHLIVKTRAKQRGKQQYERAEEKKHTELLVYEHGAALRVNLWDYLDTGLFLDHRPARRYIQEAAEGKSVLNLFCYTASVSVHAALGGASNTLSLDMSNTYLDWARRNFQRNQMDAQQHQLLRADCMQWLAEPVEQKFDLIFLDPPSFSNSKKMEQAFDVQRDHLALVTQCINRLNFGGELIFSNNRRGFKLDESLSRDFSVQNVGASSIDPDFKQNPKIHNCYSITRQRKD